MARFLRWCGGILTEVEEFAKHFVLERLEIVNGCLLKCRLFVKTVYLMHEPFKDYSAWLLRTWSGKSFHPLSNICYVR
ncbi:hypothetical protein JTE90_006328 [Oedothorax gibbosus]|uniref:Uncharacterized protein n=1 Tax=Oedothorax gibbosus TaxID=931172 RepID=A0AAV6TG36_9ARAC|nr:hypothetical protein JTE90_006328 [Oedothorax gibbosus]